MLCPNLLGREAITESRKTGSDNMARDEAYWEAERRIEAARQEGAIELDLSGRGLTEVPEAIGVTLYTLHPLKLVPMMEEIL